MKKYNKNIRLVSFFMTACVIFSTLVIYSLAAPVQHTSYNFDPRTTPVSGWSGYTECNFTGNYYSDGDSRNNAIIYCEAKGGPIADFLTCIYARITNSGGGLQYNDSQLSGTRIVTLPFNWNSNQISNNTTGYGEFGCYPLDSDDDPMYNATDSWHYAYYGYWRNAYYGWDA